MVLWGCLIPHGRVDRRPPCPPQRVLWHRFLAEQKEPVRRKLALEIIKLGMDTTHVVARFEAERQALGMMDHPNIAQGARYGNIWRRIRVTPTFQSARAGQDRTEMPAGKPALRAGPTL